MIKQPAPVIPATGAGQDIYALIGGLSAAEKTACRKSLSRPGIKKQPLHYRLFDAIADGKATSDAGAQSALSIGSGAQFSNLKQQLCNEVLHIVVQESREDSALSQLHFGLMQLEILTSRRHIALARRLFKKLWAIADAAGHYDFALQLLYYKSRMTEQHSLRQYNEEADALAETIAAYTVYQHTGQDIRRYTDRLQLLKAANTLRLSAQHLAAVQAIADDLALLAGASEATTHLRARYFATATGAAYLLQRFDACSAMTKAALQLFEQHPELCGYEPDVFLSLAETSFYNEFAAERVTEAAALLIRWDALAQPAASNSYLRRRWAVIRFNTAIKIAHKTADYLQVAAYLEESSTIIAYATQVLPAAEALSVISSICISLFVLGRYNDAEDLLIEIKERNRSLEREDVFYFALLFHLIILFEKKEWYRLDTATEAAYHLLYARKKLRPFEKELMRFLKTLSARRGVNNTTAAIRTFLLRLDVYRTDPVQRLYFLYFNYYDWLCSKLEGLSYREYKRRLLGREPAPSVEPAPSIQHQ